MFIPIFTIFFISFLSGISVLVLKKPENKNFKNLLSLSGAYLFSITIIHILPEIFAEQPNHLLFGGLVLVGFFMQQLVSLFSEGVEHGHVHHHHSHKFPIVVILSLSLHSLLEGTLLVHHSSAHQTGESLTLLWGLVIHKIPEAFTLALVLLSSIKSKNKVVLWVLIYAIASPLGIFISNWITTGNMLGEYYLQMVFALVAGNFLHISTTIFFESSPDHSFRFNKAIMTLLGATMAVGAEFIF